MNLIELKEAAELAIFNAELWSDDPKDITVSIQIDSDKDESWWCSDVDLTYDGDGQASGCVVHGYLDGLEKGPKDTGPSGNTNTPYIYPSEDEYNEKPLAEIEYKKMRFESGNVTSNSHLVCFFYILMRDHLIPGLIEDILGKRMGYLKKETYSFTNGWLAEYAHNIVNRLIGESNEKRK